MFPAARVFYTVASAVLILAAVYLGRELLIPLTLAAFLSFILAGPVRQLERWRFGRVSAVLTVGLTTAGLATGLAWLVIAQVGDVATEFSHYRSNVAAKLRVLSESVGGAVREWESTIKTISTPAPATSPAIQHPSPDPARAALTTSPGQAPPDSQPVRVEMVEPPDNSLAILGGYLRPVVHPLLTAGLTVVFALFFLTFREDLLDRIICLCGRAKINVTTAALTESGRRVTRYLGALALSNTIVGATIGAGLHLLGVPNAALWGLLTAVCRFMPFIGTTLAGLLPVAQAVAISDGWTLPLLAAGWIIVVDLLANNFLEPWFFGSRTGASLTAVIVALVLWTWLWGAIGAIVAMPITVCLLVLGKHIRALEFLRILLSDEPVLEPHVRLYQRLLSADDWEAKQIVRAAASSSPATCVCDELILPAIQRVECDRRSGFIDAQSAALAREAVLEAVGDLPPDPSAAAAAFDGLIVLDRGAFDDVIPAMLTHVGGLRTDPARVLGPTLLASEVAQRVRATRAKSVLLAAVQPRDLGRIRHVAFRLTEAAPTHVIAAVFTTDLEAPAPLAGVTLLVNPPLRELVSALRFSAAARPPEHARPLRSAATRGAARPRVRPVT